MASVWLDRALVTSPIYYALCTTQKLFEGELRRLKMARDTWPKFLSTPQSHATTHFLVNPKGSHTCAIVCIHPSDGSRSGAQVAALLVHEAVHIWQEARDNIGEVRPSPEFEAYSIQSISQRLIGEYARQVHGVR